MVMRPSPGVRLSWRVRPKRAEVVDDGATATGAARHRGGRRPGWHPGPPGPVPQLRNGGTRVPRV